MIIDKDTVEKVAHLARLELAEDEKDAMIADMNKILGFMDKLNEIDTPRRGTFNLYDQRDQRAARRCSETGK